MAEVETLRVRYGGAVLALSFVVGGAGLIYPSVMGSIALGTPVFLVGLPMLLGAVFILGGIIMAAGRTYVTITDTEVVLHAMIGPIKRRYPFERRSDLRIENEGVFVAGKKLPIHRSQARADDWRVARRVIGREREAA
jgi:hypothetical protein